MTRESDRDKSTRRACEQTRDSETKVEFTKDNVVQGYDTAGNPLGSDSSQEDLGSAGIGGSQLQPKTRR